MPDDPAGSSAYMTGTNNCECFALAFEIPLEQAMPFSNNASIIEGIHDSISDTQALIEVNSGKTKNGFNYVYSIVKTQIKPHGIQYTLIFQLRNFKGTVSNLKAFFSETGMTGVRDTQIHSLLIQQGIITLGDNNGWMRDPYDTSLQNRFLMNLSELEQFDQYFPNHPLSVARHTIKEIIENN